MGDFSNYTNELNISFLKIINKKRAHCNNLSGYVEEYSADAVKYREKFKQKLTVSKYISYDWNI